jgi:hypothetical protein
LKVIEHAIDEWYEPTVLVLLGDLHLGASNVDEKMIEQVSQRIKAPNTYWIDLGDSIDAINMRDPRFDPRMLPDWIELADLLDLSKAQVTRYKHYFGHSGANCWARLYGNHEASLQKHTERDIYASLNNAIDLDPNRALGYSGFIRLRFRYKSKGKVTWTWTQILYISHGAGNGRLAGAKALKLERLPIGWDADIYAIGHTHTKMVLQKRVAALQPKKNIIESKQKIMVNVGSYMDGLTGYPERKLMFPQALGHIELWFYPSEKRIKVIE